MFTNFCGYLAARGVGHGTISKHTSFARKILAWLDIIKPWPHTTKVQEWLTRLDHQLRNVLPPAQPQELPTAQHIWAYVDELHKLTIEQVAQDEARCVKRVGRVGESMCMVHTCMCVCTCYMHMLHAT